MARPRTHEVSRQSARTRRIRAAARRSLVAAGISGLSAVSLLIFAFVPGTAARFYDSQTLGMESITTGQLAVESIGRHAVLLSRQSAPESATRTFTDGTRTVDCSSSPVPGFEQQCFFDESEMDLLAVSGGDDVMVGWVMAVTVEGKNLFVTPTVEIAPGAVMDGFPDGTTVTGPVLEYLDSPDPVQANATAVSAGQEFGHRETPHYFRIGYTVSLKKARCDTTTCGQVSTGNLPGITFSVKETDRQ